MIRIFMSFECFGCFLTVFECFWMVLVVFEIRCVVLRYGFVLLRSEVVF